jgi:Copper type II ascorbate-dependent monooxygenase, C-terminal domain
MQIPAGQSDVVHKYSAPLTFYASAASGGEIAASAPLRIHSTGLHMHLIGRKISLRVERKDGARSCLLDIPRWDFHWQGSYALKESVLMAPGDSLALECHFDNSASNAKDVNWGEGTEDEMCLGFVYVTGA